MHSMESQMGPPSHDLSIVSVLTDPGFETEVYLFVETVPRVKDVSEVPLVCKQLCC